MCPSDADNSIAFRTTLSASRDRSVHRAQGGAQQEGALERLELPPAFAEGDVVAERYRIVRFLERGGMGEVYEAEDTLLAMRVAIKCIASELAADERMLARIKQEVLLARKVTHPNVCRLYDLGFHVVKPGAPDAGTVAFLTMDLLRGETLAAYLARKTRLTVDEARPLLAQMASALEAAHHAGVIHRDFKTRNVMLVRGAGSGAEAESPRAVVMDFGIACGAEEAAAESLESAEARWVGTPAYMAPEQVRGDPVTVATDVFSLGVVLYEMVTGRLPFESPRALTAITMRLTEAPPAPRSLVPSLDRAWSDAILRCLAREPADRFASARDVERALRPRASVKRRTGWIVAAAAVVGAAGVAGFVAREHTPYASTGDAAQPAASAPARPTVAVTALRDIGAGGDTAWMGSALAEMLATELSAGEQLRVVSSERVARVTRELALGQETKPDDAAATTRLHDVLATDYVVSGAYVVVSPGLTLRVDLSVYDARNGSLLAKIAATGSSSDLFGVVASAGEQLRQKLGVRELSTAQRDTVRAAVPESTDAVRSYTEGLLKLRGYDFRAARDAFERAIAADPSFVLAHSALARTWRALGYDARAIDEAKRALDASHDLSREEQLAVEARYRSAAREYDRAIEIYRTLFGFFPDNVDYGLEYANTLQRSGKAKESLAVLDTLHRLPKPAGDDPRIDFQEAVSASKISDTARRLSAAKAAIAKADPPRSSLAADARTHLGEALSILGDAKGASDAFEAARTDYVALGDRAGEASALGNLAQLASSRGDATRGVELAERALSITRETGDQYRTAGMLNTIGIAKYGLGQTGDAKALWEEARGIYEAIGNHEGVGHTVGNIGVAYEDLGELDRAKSSYVQSLQVLRSIGNRAGVFDEEGNLGELALQEAELGDALTHETAAFEEARAIGGKGMLGRMKSQQAQRLRHEGDIAGATRAIDEALALRKEADEASSEDLALAALLALDDGRAGDAEVQARHAAHVLHEQRARSLEVSALSVLAKALAAQSKSDEASSVAAQATALAATLEKVTARLDAASATGAAQLAAGHATDAGATFAAGAQLAKKHGFVACELDARLALARTKQGAERRAAMAQVERDAKARGLVRIAKLAK